MRTMILIFSGLLLSSCGGSGGGQDPPPGEGEKTACQVWEELKICTEKQIFREVKTCINSAIQDVDLKLKIKGIDIQIIKSCVSGTASRTPSSSQTMGDKASNCLSEYLNQFKKESICN